MLDRLSPGDAYPLRDRWALKLRMGLDDVRACSDSSVMPSRTRKWWSSTMTVTMVPVWDLT